MPIITKIVPFDRASLWIWAIQESEEDLKNALLLTDQDLLGQKSNENRRKQWLATRSILAHAGIPAEITYLPTGKPLLQGYHISISHTTELAGVYLAEGIQNEIGLDVEKIHPRIMKISQRFMNEFEKEQFGIHDLEKSTIIWSAKEALFKKHGAETTYFASKQKILSIDQENRLIKARIEVGGKSLEEQLAFHKIGDSVLVYTLNT